MQAPSNLNGALAQLLAGLRGRDIVALLNRGNRGDGVIHLGGRRLLSSLGITFREVSESTDLSELRGDVLLVYGAGALAPGPLSLLRKLESVAPRFGQVVILPSSISLAESRVRAFARSWDRNYFVFCREMVTYESLRQAGVRPGALMLGHDLAFHADLSPWAARSASGRAGIFRCDNEAAYGRLPRELAVIEDASRGTEREPERLLDFVARFEEIHTDRCHGAITAAMMGRQVVLYRNSYFKNQAIYEHSLAPMPNVRFVERTPFSFGQFWHAMYWARLRPVEMKVRRVFQGRRTESPSRA
jgi:hypothetical protein